jgi:hypothetical protein
LLALLRLVLRLFLAGLFLESFVYGYGHRAPLQARRPACSSALGAKQRPQLCDKLAPRARNCLVRGASGPE